MPNNPLKALNSYIIVSPERNLIIDAGFNRPECEQILLDGINSLNLDFSQTDLLLTHRHSDHTGLAFMLEKKGCRVYAGAHEIPAIERMASADSWEWFYDRIKIFGLSEYNITHNDNPGWRYRLQTMPQCRPLSEGDELKYGEYVFTVVDVPGHTPGHIGLYEPNRRLFFCGDHILLSVTPNISFWGFEQDSLAQYMDSLRKVRKMQIDWLFTAHREIILNVETRINELLEHHEKRLAEILDILADGAKTACQTAIHMEWNLNVKEWAEFPKAQKYFATGEASAHLEYLTGTKQIGKTVRDGVIYYHKFS